MIWDSDPEFGQSYLLLHMAIKNQSVDVGEFTGIARQEAF